MLASTASRVLPRDWDDAVIVINPAGIAQGRQKLRKKNGNHSDTEIDRKVNLSDFPLYLSLLEFAS